MTFKEDRILDAIPVAVTVVLWGVIFAALPPDRQDFPLNDDWAYSKGLFALTRGEGIHYYRQPSMPLLGQWLLSYPVVRVVGESHATLRLVTVALSVLGTLAYQDLLRRESGSSPRQACFAAATLAMNPLYFLMSGSFMSDVPALALSLLALAAYSRAVRDGRLGWLAAATVLASLACINRQNAVVAPIVAGILLWRRRPLRRHPAWLVGVLFPVTAGIVANSWFTSRPDAVPLAPSLPTSDHFFLLWFAGTVYLGLSALPLLALRPGVVSGGRFLVALALLFNGAIFWFWTGDGFVPPHAYHGGLFPYLENIITPWGTLESDIYVVGQRPLMMGRGNQAFLSLVGCVSGAALADRLVGRLRGGSSAGALSLFTALHLLLLLISPTLYDRYLIVLLPGTLALAAGASLRLRWPAGLGVLALFAICSVGLMHDWLSWNSARWELGRRALACGIPVAEIEGGLEWDSWHAPGPVAPALPQLPSGLMLPFNRVRFPHISGRYALAFSMVPGTVVIDSQPYRLWLVPGDRRFLLLERREDAEGSMPGGYR